MFSSLTSAVSTGTILSHTVKCKITHIPSTVCVSVLCHLLMWRPTIYTSLTTIYVQLQEENLLGRTALDVWRDCNEVLLGKLPFLQCDFETQGWKTAEMDGRKETSIKYQLPSHNRRLVRPWGADQAKAYNDHLIRGLVFIKGWCCGRCISLHDKDIECRHLGIPVVDRWF